jgi:hypothetical protein
MEAKEEAIELINRFANSQKSVFPNSILHRQHGKLDALLCVDKILEGSRLFYNKDYIYWAEVKQEINKL